MTVRRSLVVVPLVALVLALLPMTPVSAAALVRWTVQTADPAALVEGDAVLAVDPSAPRVVYFDAARASVLEARLVGGAWAVQALGGAFDVLNGYHVAVALDAAGGPHVAYVERATEAVRYARWDGSSWAVALVEAKRAPPPDGLPPRPVAPRLAFGPDGEPHVAYSVQDPYAQEVRSVVHAQRVGGGWRPETVASAIAAGNGFLALAVDGAGTPHLVYNAGMTPNGALTYARHAGTGWVTERIGADAYGSSIALAVDATGTPHVAYDVSLLAVRYARRSATGWVDELVDDADVSRPLALAVDAGGAVHLAYKAWTSPRNTSALRYARRDTVGWAPGIVETVDIFTAVGLVLDARGNPRVAYALPGAGLRYATGTVLGVRGVLPLVLQRASP
jgi:hypothetical protein